MFQRVVRAVVLSVGVLALGSASVVAEEPHAHGGADAQMTTDMGAGSCEHCQQSAKDLDEVMAKLERAKQSNDLAEIRATLNDVQAPLAQLKEHMTMCQMKMGQAADLCSMCKVKLNKDGRCPHCGMKM